MTRQQKSILIILGVLDLVVIAAIGGIVFATTRQAAAPPTPAPALSACDQALIQAFPAQAKPLVSWDARTLHLTLVQPQSPTTAEDGAQYLWAALDTLAQVFTGQCVAPETLILIVAESGEAEALRHTAQLKGEDFRAWVKGDIDDTTLAARALYRESAAEPAP